MVSKADALSGKEFRDRRKAMGGMSQMGLAQRMHVAVTTIQNWENGRNKVPGSAQAALELLEDEWRRKEGRNGDGI